MRWNVAYTGACLPMSFASRVLNGEGGAGCLQRSGMHCVRGFRSIYVHTMVELRQQDLVVPLLSLETRDHGKQHTHIRTETVHVGSGGACQGCMNA